MNPSGSGASFGAVQDCKSLVRENSDVILEYLAGLDVEFVFGVPGGGIEPLYNALARSQRKGGPRAVIARHETGAAFMADGYARESKRLGVCCATTGPGTTNLITGVASAYADGIPMLVITAQTSIGTFGKKPAQESSCTGVNTMAMFSHCTRYNTLVSHTDQLEQKLLTAITYALGSSPGPVHLSIPVDILRSQAPNKKFPQSLVPLAQQEVLPSQDCMDALCAALAEAEDGVLLVGKDSEPAIAEILRFAEQRSWSLVTTPMGKGLIDSRHPLYRGVFGLAGHSTAREALLPDAADLVIAIGTALDENASYGWDEETVLTKRLIHIDANLEHLSQSMMALLRVQACPKLVFEKLNAYQSEQEKSGASQIAVARVKAVGKELLKTRRDVAKIGQLVSDVCTTEFSVVEQELKPGNTGVKLASFDLVNSKRVGIKPQELFLHLSNECPADTRVTVDIGNSFLWGIHYWRCRHEVDTEVNLFRAGMRFASMGWALGAAVGGALANPNRPVVCMTGDGSVLMNGQEMTVALEERLPILFVILNDAAFGTVRHGQRLAGAESIGWKLPDINFKSFAEAMGIPSRRVETMEDIANLDIAQLLQAGGPCVLDVVIDGEEVPPLAMRMKVLGTARCE